MKFEKGTLVEVAMDLEDYDLYEGEKGVIKDFSDEENAYVVEFVNKRASLHECNGLVPSGKGLYLSEKELRLV